MTEEYVVRDDEVDLMHNAKPRSLKEFLDDSIERLTKIAMARAVELDNLLDFILYPHTHEEITRYANDLSHRLMEAQ